MRVIWNLAKFVAAVIVVFFGLSAAASVMELYLVLSGSAVPGEPIFLDTLAPTAQESAVRLAICAMAIAAAVALSFFANSKLTDRPN